MIQLKEYPVRPVLESLLKDKTTKLRLKKKCLLIV